MKKTLYILMFGLFIGTTPALVFAEQYHYIQMDGTVQTIEASTSQEALNTSRKDPDVLHTGVALDQGMLQEGDVYATLYNYVDKAGNLKSVVAASNDAAFILATDISPHSGVIRLERVVEQK